MEADLRNAKWLHNRMAVRAKYAERHTPRVIFLAADYLDQGHAESELERRSPDDHFRHLCSKTDLVKRRRGRDTETRWHKPGLWDACADAYNVGATQHGRSISASRTVDAGLRPFLVPRELRFFPQDLHCFASSAHVRNYELHESRFEFKSSPSCSSRSHRLDGFVRHHAFSSWLPCLVRSIEYTSTMKMKGPESFGKRSRKGLDKASRGFRAALIAGQAIMGTAHAEPRKVVEAEIETPYRAKAERISPDKLAREVLGMQRNIKVGGSYDKIFHDERLIQKSFSVARNAIARAANLLTQFGKGTLRGTSKLDQFKHPGVIPGQVFDEIDGVQCNFMDFVFVDADGRKHIMRGTAAHCINGTSVQGAYTTFLDDVAIRELRPGEIDPTVEYLELDLSADEDDVENDQLKGKVILINTANRGKKSEFYYSYYIDLTNEVRPFLGSAAGDPALVEANRFWFPAPDNQFLDVTTGLPVRPGAEENLAGKAQSGTGIISLDGGKMKVAGILTQYDPSNNNNIGIGVGANELHNAAVSYFSSR